MSTNSRTGVDRYFHLPQSLPEAALRDPSIFEKKVVESQPHGDAPAVNPWPTDVATTLKATLGRCGSRCVACASDTTAHRAPAVQRRFTVCATVHSHEQSRRHSSSPTPVWQPPVNILRMDYPLGVTMREARRVDLGTSVRYRFSSENRNSSRRIDWSSAIIVRRGSSGHDSSWANPPCSKCELNSLIGSANSVAECFCAIIRAAEARRHSAPLKNSSHDLSCRRIASNTRSRANSVTGSSCGIWLRIRAVAIEDSVFAISGESRPPRRSHYGRRRW